MNWIQKTLNKARSLYRGSQNLQWTINTAGEWVYQNGSEAYIDGGYKSLPNVYAIISLILSKSTIVPFEIFRKRDEAKYRKYKAAMSQARTTKDFAKCIKLKNEALEKVENTELEKLLLEPNSYQTGEQLNWELDGYKLLTGNAILYLLSVADGGKPKELHNIPSPMVDMVVKGTPFEPIFQYKVSFLQDFISDENIMHLKYWNPVSGTCMPGEQFWGMSPLQACEKLLGRYKDADITQGFQFKNQGPAGILVSDANQDLTDEQARAVQDKYNQQYSGIHNVGKVMVAGKKLSWLQFGLSAVDLNIIESKKEIRTELCNEYKVPEELFGGDKKYNNFEQARRALITDAVIPLVEARKQGFQRSIVDRFDSGLILEYDYTIFHEMQDDLDKLADTMAKMDFITYNEKRAATGYDRYEDPAADIIYVPSGLIPIADLNGRVEDIDEESLDPNTPQ